VFGLVLIEAMRAPFRDPEWLRKLLLGALLGLIPVLNFVAWGYVYRVFIDALNGAERTTLPVWRDWRAYLGAGFRLFIIAVVYLVLGMVGLAGAASVLGLVPAGEDPGRTSALLLLVMGLIAALYGFLPIAFTRFAAEGRIWAAFDPEALWAEARRVVKGDYVQGCFALFGFWLAGNLILGIFPTYVFLLVLWVYAFYVALVFARVFGTIIGIKGHNAPTPKAT
jgi:hypothetical protein